MGKRAIIWLMVPCLFWMVSIGISFSDTQLVIQLKDGKRDTFPLHAIDRIEFSKSEGAGQLFMRGLNLHAGGKYREAIEDFTRALESEPKNAEILGARGRSFYVIKDYKRALGDFDSAITSGARNDWVYLLRGMVKKELGDLNGAEGDFIRAMEMEPASRLTRLNLSTLYLEKGKAVEAIESVSPLIDKDPSDREAREIRARASSLTGNFPSAVKDLDELIKQDPSRAEYFALRGTALLGMKEEGRARDDLERGRRLNPASEEIKKLEALLVGVPSSPASSEAAVALGASVKDFVGDNELNAVAAAMESMRLLMGSLSPEEEKKFLSQWGPLFEFPTEESKGYLDRILTLMEELHLLRGQIATAAYEFDAAWQESVMAAAYGSEKGAREALSIAERNKALLEALQAKLEQIKRKAEAAGNQPDNKAAKKRARKDHEVAVKLVKKAMAAKQKVPAAEEKKNEPPSATGSPSHASSLAPQDRESMEKMYPAEKFDQRMKPAQIERIRRELSEGKIPCYYYCRRDYCEGRCGGLEDGLILRDGKLKKGSKFAGECSKEQVAKKDLLCEDHGKIIGTMSPTEETKKLLPPPVMGAQTPILVEIEDLSEDEEVATTGDTEKSLKDTLSFHFANIRIIEKNLAKDEEELAKETDPARRGALEWRIINAKSDLQHEKDLIMSIKTGQYVHMRTPFDDFAQARFIESIKENQRRMEDYTRTMAAMNRLAGMLPDEEGENARAFIRRQLPFEVMAKMDKDKASKVAHAIHEKVKGYYEKESARAAENEAWANFGLEAAQNIRTGAETGLFACSMFGGRGVMIAYQGVTGYIEGGPKEAALKAVSWYSTPTYIASEALRGYESGGVKGAAEAGAIAYISGKAFEYGVSKISNFVFKPAGKVGVARSEATAPVKTVNEVLSSEQFKAARARGEKVARKFAQAQAELQELGKKGAPAEEIIKKQAEVRQLVAEVNADFQAKNFLKYRGDPLSQRAYNAHLKSVHAEVEARFHEIMGRKGWNRQDLKEFRNAASAGSVGMDYDIGLVEKPTWIADKDGKPKLNRWLVKDGKPQTVEKWQKDAQEAWNESYKKVTGFSAEKSWETVTTSAHAESYRDLNILSKDKNALKKIWAEQTADVTRYKMHHALNDPHLSYMEKLQEVSRGTAKDMETKLIPLLERAQTKSEGSAKALKKSIEHWKEIKRVLADFGNNTIDPIKANRIIRKHTGGKSIPEVVDDASVLLESLIKFAK